MIGKPWTLSQIEEAIDRGLHVPVLQSVATKLLAEDFAAKDKKFQFKVVLWDNIKDNPPEELKVSPIAMIPHKSGLVFRAKAKNGELLPSVDDMSVKTAPQGATDQFGHSIMLMIHTFAQADEDMKICMEKWDIKDRFWRLHCALGE